jgi:hypothetical protein
MVIDDQVKQVGIQCANCGAVLVVPNLQGSGEGVLTLLCSAELSELAHLNPLEPPFPKWFYTSDLQC